MVRRAVAALLIALLAAPGSPAQEESLSSQVNRAIDRGVAWLKKVPVENGSFPCSEATHYPDGAAALALYALLKSGVRADDPVVVRGLEWVRGHKVEKTYCAAVRILALDATGDPSHDGEIRDLARWLEATFDRKDRLWAYPVGPNANYRKTDLSNTQYAALGLFAAERHGWKPDAALWGGLLRRLLDLQDPDGGFVYADNRGDKRSTGSMTTGAVLVMTLALSRADTADGRVAAVAARGKAALARAWDYLDRRFRPDLNPDGPYAYTSRNLYYYLYGVERIAAMARRKEVGGKDWYREGARVLLRLQRPEGDWETLAQTCFALLFLRRATTTLVDGQAPPAPEGNAVDVSEGPPKPAAGVPFVRRWLVLGPLPNPDDSLLDARTPVEEDPSPKAGSGTALLQWKEYSSPSNGVDFEKCLRLGAPGLYCAFTWIHAAQDVDAVLWLGHDDGARVLLDGMPVHDCHLHDSVGPDGHSERVRIAAGAHRLMVKVDDVGGGSGFHLRFALPDGSPVPGLIPALSARSRELPETAAAQPDFFSLEDLLKHLPAEPRPRLGFDEEADVGRAVLGATSRGFPKWVADGFATGVHRPWSGFRGALGLHPVSREIPGRLFLKLRVPPGKPVVTVRVSSMLARPADERAGDGVLRISAFDGALRLLAEEAVGGSVRPEGDPWRSVEAPLKDYAGKDLLLVLEVAAGGSHPWWNEELWIDEIAVR